MKINLALGAFALVFAAASPAAAHMTKSQTATMQRCHAMSHSRMVKNHACMSMMKMHGSAMGSHAMMKKGAMKDDMMNKDSMSPGMMNNSTTPKNH